MSKKFKNSDKCQKLCRIKLKTSTKVKTCVEQIEKFVEKEIKKLK